MKFWRANDMRLVETNILQVSTGLISPVVKPAERFLRWIVILFNGDTSELCKSEKLYFSIRLHTLGNESITTYL